MNEVFPFTDFDHPYHQHNISRVRRNQWRPATDVYDTENEVVVHIDLPGVPKEEIDIESDSKNLTVSGHHKGGEGYPASTSRVRERNVGRFRKVVELPPGCNPDEVKAHYSNGLLEIKIAKVGPTNGKLIPIK